MGTMAGAEEPIVLDQALRPVAVGRGEGSSSGRGVGRMSDCTVKINKLVDARHPVENAVDGDVNTYAWPAAAKRDVMEVTTYDFIFDKTRKINCVRFFQHHECFSYAFKILGSKDGKSFEQVLVDRSEADPTIPAGEWQSYSFETQDVLAVRFEPSGGVAPYPLYLDLCSPPALAGFEVFFSDTPVKKAESTPVDVSVDAGAVLNINGQDQIRNAMFAVSNIPRDREFSAKYLAELNLGMITIWPSTLNNVPADSNGKFDRSYFEKGGGYERDAVWEGAVCEIARDILKCKVSIRCEKAPPSMRLMGFESTNLVKNSKTGELETQFNPPADPVEWGKMAGMAMQNLNSRFPGVVTSIELWNEPNTTRYWPMPIPEKASSYRKFFSEAAPAIRSIMPDLEIEGPVTSGAGVLGWAGIPKPNDLPPDQHWKQFVKGMVDECGPYLDQFNSHPYSTDADCQRAEARLLANYSSLKLGRVVPLSGSEANAATVFGHPGIDFSTLAWRKNVVDWANFFLPLLNEPDKFASLTYFYITTGNPHDHWGMFNGFGPPAVQDTKFTAHNSRMFDIKPGRPTGPQPIYFLYNLMRNLRGSILPSSISNNGQMNVVASRQGNSVNIILQNRTSHPHPVSLSLSLPRDIGMVKTDLEALEYDVKEKRPMLKKKDCATGNGKINFEASPFGIYSVIVKLSNEDFPVKIKHLNSFYGDHVWDPIALEGKVEFMVNIPKMSSPDNAIGKATLNFGTAGIPLQRPRRKIDQRVPVEITVNGSSKGRILAGEFNSISLEPSELKERNTILIRRINCPEIDTRIVNPQEMFIMSVEIETVKYLSK